MANEQEQRYFRVDFSDFMRASDALWAADDEASRPRTRLSTSALGRDTSVWTSDLAHQDRLRTILDKLEINYQEDGKQQVRTFLDGNLS